MPNTAKLRRSRGFQGLRMIALVVFFAQIVNAAMQSSVSQYGFTWTFDKQYETGSLPMETGGLWVPLP